MRILRLAGTALCWLSVVVGTLVLASGLAVVTNVILAEEYRDSAFGFGFIVAAIGLAMGTSGGAVLLWRTRAERRKNKSVTVPPNSPARGWSDRKNLIASLVVALIIALLPSGVRTVEFLAAPNACNGGPTTWECGWEEPDEILLPFDPDLRFATEIEVEVDQFNGAGDGKADLRLHGNDIEALDLAYFWDKESTTRPTTASTCKPKLAFRPSNVPAAEAVLGDGEYLCMVGSAASVVMLHLAYDGVHLNVYPAL